MKRKWKKLLSAMVAACMISVVSPLNTLAMDAFTESGSSYSNTDEGDSDSLNNDPPQDQDAPPLDQDDPSLDQEDFVEPSDSVDSLPDLKENGKNPILDGEQDHSEGDALSSGDGLAPGPSDLDTGADLNIGDSVTAEAMLAEFDWLTSQAREMLADYLDGLAEKNRSQAIEEAREALTNAQTEPAPAARLLSEARLPADNIASLLNLELEEVQNLLGANDVLTSASDKDSVTVRYVLEEDLAAAGYLLYQGNDLYDEYTARLDSNTGRITSFGVWVSTADDKNRPLQQNKEVTMTLADDVEGRNKDNLSQTWKFKAGTVISQLDQQGNAKFKYGSYTDKDQDGYSDDGKGFGFAVFPAGTAITIRVSADLPDGAYTHWVDSLFGDLALSGRVIGNSREEYYTYCADPSLAYPSNNGIMKFKPELTYRKASPAGIEALKGKDITGNQQLARVLMAGYPYDRFGLSRLTNSDFMRAFMTQNAVWEILYGKGEGFGDYYDALVNYGKTGILPDGFTAEDELSISILGDTIELAETLDEKSAFDGKYVGILELSNASDSLTLTGLPQGVKLYPYSETHPTPDDEALKAIPMKGEIGSNSGRFYVVSDQDALDGEIQFSYIKYQIIDPDSLGLFVTDLISVDGEGKNPKQYQPMIGFQWKSLAGTVSASAFRFTKVAGSLEVEKNVKGLEALPDDYSITLTLTREGTEPYTKTVTLTRKEFAQGTGEDGAPVWTASVKVRLPYGTYRVTEANAAVDGFTLKSDTSQAGLVDASGSSNTLKVLNEYDPKNTSGSLTVRKTVQGVEELPEDYQVILLLAGPQGGNSASQEIILTQWVESQDPRTGETLWTASKTLTDLPDGTYTLTEKSARELEAFELAGVEISPAGTVDRESRPETMTAVNTYVQKELAPFMVQKIVTGPANLPDGYWVTLSIYDQAGELVQSVTLREWEQTGDRTWTASQTVTGLPAGNYTVRETNVSSLNGYVLASVEEGRTGTVGWEPSEQEPVIVTNVYQVRPTDNGAEEYTPDYENNNGREPSPYRPYNPVVYYPDEVIIPDDPVPLMDPPDPDDNGPEEIPDDEAPLAQPDKEEAEEILDDGVPLAGLPKTGDTSAAHLYLALSALAAGGLLALKKRKK